MFKATIPQSALPKSMRSTTSATTTTTTTTVTATTATTAVDTLSQQIQNFVPTTPPTITAAAAATTSGAVVQQKQSQKTSSKRKGAEDDDDSTLSSEDEKTSVSTSKKSETDDKKGVRFAPDPRFAPVPVVIEKDVPSSTAAVATTTTTTAAAAAEAAADDDDEDDEDGTKSTLDVAAKQKEEAFTTLFPPVRVEMEQSTGRPCIVGFVSEQSPFCDLITTHLQEIARGDKPPSAPRIQYEKKPKDKRRGNAFNMDPKSIYNGCRIIRPAKFQRPLSGRVLPQSDGQIWILEVTDVEPDKKTRTTSFHFCFLKINIKGVCNFVRISDTTAQRIYGHVMVSDKGLKNGVIPIVSARNRVLYSTRVLCDADTAHCLSVEGPEYPESLYESIKRAKRFYQHDTEHGVFYLRSERMPDDDVRKQLRDVISARCVDLTEEQIAERKRILMQAPAVATTTTATTASAPVDADAADPEATAPAINGGKTSLKKRKSSASVSGKKKIVKPVADDDDADADEDDDDKKHHHHHHHHHATDEDADNDETTMPQTRKKKDEDRAKKLLKKKHAVVEKGQFTYVPQKTLSAEKKRFIAALYRFIEKEPTQGGGALSAILKSCHNWGKARVGKKIPSSFVDVSDLDDLVKRVVNDQAQSAKIGMTISTLACMLPILCDAENFKHVRAPTADQPDHEDDDEDDDNDAENTWMH